MMRGMLWPLSIVFLLVTCSRLAQSQEIPECAASCLNQQSDCAAIDVTCLCTSTSAQASLQQCVTTGCTAEDQATALQLLATVCAGVGITPTLSLSTTGAGATNGGTAPTESTPVPSGPGTEDDGTAHTPNSTGTDDQAPPTSRNSGNPPTGAIVGGVLGGLATLGLLCAGLFLLLRRKQQERQREQVQQPDEGSTLHPQPQQPMRQMYPASLDSSWGVKPYETLPNSTTSPPTALVTPTSETPQHHAAYNAANPGSYTSSGSDLPALPAGGTALTASGMFYGSSDAKTRLRPSERVAASSAASTGTSDPITGAPATLTSSSAASPGDVTEALARLSLDQLKPAQREIVASLQAHGVVGAAIADVVAKMIRENQQSGSGQPSGSVPAHARAFDAPPGYDFKEARDAQ